MHPIDAILIETCLLQEPPAKETELRTLGISSFRFAQLLLDIEETCGVTFSESQMDNMVNIKTVGDLYEMLEAAQAQE